MVLVKKLGNFLFCIPERKRSYNYLKTKNAVLDDKNKKLKNSKNWFFSKGVSPWFWSKLGNFLSCIPERKRSYDYLKTKNAFLDDNNKKLKNSKNCFFSKGLSPWFLSKSATFPMFFFQAK